MHSEGAKLLATAKSHPAGGTRHSSDIAELAAAEQKDIPIYRECIGTLDGYVNAPIKAQVNGYLPRQNYAEGAFVGKGQVLFEFDHVRRPRRNWCKRKRNSPVRRRLGIARNSTLRKYVQLYKTLGGGWQIWATTWRRHACLARMRALHLDECGV